MTINGDGDLALTHRDLVYNVNPMLVIVKLTRGGLVLLQSPNNVFYSIPPKNCDLFKGDHNESK